ncbi:hypothetical protein [Sandarakinorhabdus glacialis]|nr:hypothetical protein [Polymorphobacter glacialis]
MPSWRRLAAGIEALQLGDIDNLVWKRLWEAKARCGGQSFWISAL